MNKYQKKFAAAIAGAGLLLNAALPVFATTVVISGNGASSDNFAEVNQNVTTSVTQTNDAFVMNNVDSDATTGGNTADFNTGGEVVIGTGDATSVVDVANSLNTNQAAVSCCEAGGTDVLIEGNGSYSLNDVKLNQNNTVVVNQDNKAVVKNNVDSDAKTGGNDAGLNTGGDVVIMTGNAGSGVSVSTQANSNTAYVGGGSASVLPTASFRIIGNGSGTENYITANLNKNAVVDQDNFAMVSNYVNADAKTGKNDAMFNTGGESMILTGDATSLVDVDNMVNFNHANIDCGCTWDLLAKIEGNGATPVVGPCQDSLACFPILSDANVIKLNLNSNQVYGQDNMAMLCNHVDTDATTGWNDNSLNTGDPEGEDPVIMTGAAYDSSTISNSGNTNTIGGGSPLVPWWPTDLSGISVSFNLSAFMAFLGLSIN